MRSVPVELGEPGQQTEFIIWVSSDQLVVTIQSATLRVLTLKQSRARIYRRCLLSMGERGEWHPSAEAGVQDYCRPRDLGPCSFSLPPVPNTK